MILVLGGGPAGRIAAIRLAAAEKDVTLVEAGGVSAGIGGQCLHFGCMPVCALNDAARFLRTAGELSDLGIAGEKPVLRFNTLLNRTKEVQQKIAAILDNETRDAGVSVVYGKHGRMEGPQAYIGNEPVAAEAVIIATGSRPNIPNVGGVALREVYTPHTLWSLQDLPGEIAIVGGGTIAAEFAYVLSALGSRVTVVARSGFLSGMDNHLRALAMRDLAGVKILENTGLLSIEGSSQVTGVRISSGGRESTIAAGSVLLATGLIPRTEAIEGVKKGPGGEIVVDDHMRTSIPGVYAAGDVTGPPYLTPVARMQGTVAADNILGIGRKMDYSFIPQAIYLGHDLAFCGKASETSASIAFPGPAGPGTFWGVPSSGTGLAKAMVEDDGTICGICAAGPAGGVIAGYLALLMREGYTAHDFEGFIEVHPSTDGMYGLLKFASGVLKKRGGEG